MPNELKTVLRITLVDAPGGEPSYLASTSPDGSPEYALDLTMLLRLLTTWGPIIAQLFSGGFSPALVQAIITTLLSFLNPADAQRVQASIGGQQ